MRRPGADYRVVTEVDARGNPTREAFDGGDLGVVRAYYPQTGQVASIRYANLSNPNLRVLSYAYDVFGNLGRQTLSGATQEDFTYDALHRLTEATRTGTGTGTVQYTYDAVGNFVSKSDFSLNQDNAYGYTGGSCGGGPNAVKTVQIKTGGTRSYCYDANGNLRADSAGLVMKYDHTQRPVQIVRGGITRTFRYDASGTRFWQFGGGESTQYFPWVEKRYGAINDEKTYLGSRTVVTTQGGVRRVETLLTDRLGSVEAVANADGAMIESRGYDAFGKPRLGTWANAPNDRLGSTANTPHGFTGHEHLNSLNLIHMNGRVYDYALGRFTGVDPVIQFPLNSQSLNPYSYILNNPLSGTDPTGYECEAMTGSHICGVDTGAENGQSNSTRTTTGSSGEKVTVKTTVYANGPTVIHASRTNGADSQSSKTKNQEEGTKGTRANLDQVDSSGKFTQGQYQGEKPLRGTYYFGGAGMNGDYVDDTVQALSEAGIEGVAAADTDTFSNGTISDAAIGVAAMVYNLPDYNVKLTQSAAGTTSSQFNMIGYSYGSLAAAQVADEYSRSGGVVNNLVLVGSPIGKKFLGDLFAQRNIQNTLIVNLRNRGDLIYAGMPHRSLNVISPVIGKQMLQQNGHFYYAPNSQEGQRRRRALANALYAEGLR